MTLKVMGSVTILNHLYVCFPLTPCSSHGGGGGARSLDAGHRPQYAPRTAHH
jgi:hypothetical protein